MDEDVKKALREKLTVSVEVAGRAFGLSRNPAYTAVKTGEIPSIKIGGRIVVPTSQVRRMLGIEEVA
jgi:hypothetical protein